MKILLTTIFTTCLALFSISQGNSELMNVGAGPGDFAVDKKIGELEHLLHKDSRKIGDGYPTSTYKINLKKAGLETYYGFKVDTAFVEFDGEFTSEHVPINEDVYTITLYLEKPSDPKKKYKLRTQLKEKYGDTDEMWSPDMTMLVSLQWWGEITMLVVNFGVDDSTGEELNYYKVEFIQAYGG